jgi:hypothetical protein
MHEGDEVKLIACLFVHLISSRSCGLSKEQSCFRFWDSTFGLPKAHISHLAVSHTRSPENSKLGHVLPFYSLNCTFSTLLNLLQNVELRPLYSIP